MSLTITPKVQLELKPVLKSIVYAALAGEFLRNTGMTDDAQLNAVQQAVAEGLVERVIVFARRLDGGVDEFELKMTPPAQGETLNLALAPGKSILETVDVTLAASVKAASDLIKRRGLTPQYQVGWSARVRANPAIGADAIKRLNLNAEALPPPPPSPPIGSFSGDIFATPPPSPPPPPTRYRHTVNTYVGPPPIPPKQIYRPVVEIKPAADPNVSFTWRTSVNKT